MQELIETEATERSAPAAVNAPRTARANATGPGPTEAGDVPIRIPRFRKQ